VKASGFFCFGGRGFDWIKFSQNPPPHPPHISESDEYGHVVDNDFISEILFEQFVFVPKVYIFYYFW